MPNYKTHLIGGLISFALVIRLAALYMPIFNISTSLVPIAFALSMIGSIFPDIDVPSKMQKWFFIASFGGVLITLLTKHYHLFALIGICILFVAFLTHRTITHKPAFLVMFSLIPALYACYSTPEYTYTAFALYLYFTTGCLSHVLFDRILSRFKRLVGKSHRF